MAHQDARPVALLQARDNRIVQRSRSHNHAIQLAAVQDTAIECVVIRVSRHQREHQIVTALIADLCDALSQLRKERIGEQASDRFGDNQANRVGASGDERACCLVRLVVVLADDLPDALAHLGPDIRAVVDDT